MWDPGHCKAIDTDISSLHGSQRERERDFHQVYARCFACIQSDRCYPFIHIRTSPREFYKNRVNGQTNVCFVLFPLSLPLFLSLSSFCDDINFWKMKKKKRNKILAFLWNLYLFALCSLFFFPSFFFFFLFQQWHFSFIRSNNRVSRNSLRSEIFRRPSSRHVDSFDRRRRWPRWLCGGGGGGEIITGGMKFPSCWTIGGKKASPRSQGRGDERREEGGRGEKCIEKRGMGGSGKGEALIIAIHFLVRE